MAGDSAQGMRLANDLSQRFPKDTTVQSEYLPMIHSAIILGSGNPSKGTHKAIEALAAAAPYETVGSPIPVLPGRADHPPLDLIPGVRTACATLLAAIVLPGDQPAMPSQERCRKFSAEPSAVGKTIVVDGKARQIIGVLPRDFRFLDMQELALILPLPLDRNKTNLGNFSYFGIARLNPGSTIAQPASTSRGCFRAPWTPSRLHPASASICSRMFASPRASCR